MDLLGSESMWNIGALKGEGGRGTAGLQGIQSEI